MKNNYLLCLVILMGVSCRLESSRILVNYNAKPASSMSLSNVQLANHQIIINGANLDKVTSVTINDGSTPHSLVIESVSASKIIANTASNMTIMADKLMDLVLSSASAAATYSVNFSSCDSELNGAGFNCSITPVADDVLAYDSVSNTWIPKSIAGPWSVLSGNAYKLTGNVGIGLNNPTAVLEVAKTNATDHTLMKAEGTLSTTASDIKGMKINLVSSPTAITSNSTIGLDVEVNYNSSYNSNNAVTGILSKVTTAQYMGRPTSITGGAFLAMPAAGSGYFGVYGSRSSSSMNNGATTSIFGSTSSVSIWGHQTTNAYATHNELAVSGFTDALNGYGGYFKISSTDNLPDIENAYGVYSTMTTTGGVVNGYGVYIDTVKGTTKKHSLYAADSTAPSYFAGSVGVGIAAPAQKLDVVGDIKTSGCLYYSGGSIGACASDERIKKDVHPYQLGLKELLGINPVNFKYIAPYDQTIGSQTQIGVIAQQVEKVSPQLIKKKIIENPVDSTTREIKAVDYGAFTFIIINAVKEFHQTWFADSQKIHRDVAELQAENALLKKENEEMKTRMEKIEKMLANKKSN